VVHGFDQWGCHNFQANNTPERDRRRYQLEIEWVGFDGWAFIREELMRLDQLWEKSK